MAEQTKRTDCHTEECNQPDHVMERKVAENSDTKPKKRPNSEAASSAEASMPSTSQNLGKSSKRHKKSPPKSQSYPDNPIIIEVYTPGLLRPRVDYLPIEPDGSMPKKILKCDPCKTFFVTKALLVEHMNEAHGEEVESDSEPSDESVPDLKKKKPSLAKPQVKDTSSKPRSRSPLRPYKCPLVDCLTFFEFQFQVPQHYVENHLKTWVYRCIECGKCFVDDENLQEHKAEMDHYYRETVPCLKIDLI